METTAITPSNVLSPIETNRVSDFSLSKTHSLHFGGSNETVISELQSTGASTGAGISGFGNMLLHSLDQGNELLKRNDELRYQAILEPDSVDAHEVVLASEKATMAISITRSVIDRALEAYRTIIALR